MVHASGAGGRGRVLLAVYLAPVSLPLVSGRRLRLQPPLSAWVEKARVVSRVYLGSVLALACLPLRPTLSRLLTRGADVAPSLQPRLADPPGCRGAGWRSPASLGQPYPASTQRCQWPADDPEAPGVGVSAAGRDGSGPSGTAAYCLGVCSPPPCPPFPSRPRALAVLGVGQGRPEREQPGVGRGGAGG